MKSNISKTLVALGLLLVTSLPALAQSGHSGGCSCGQFSSKPIPFKIEHGTTAYQNAAFDEFARWNNVANIFSASLGDGTIALNNGSNEIALVTGFEDFTSDVFGICIISPQSAFGSPSFNACPKPGGVSCGTFQETDVLINADFARGFTPNGPPDFDDNNGPAYYGATALHEIGHALGLHHNFDNLSTMNYYEDYAAQYLAIADAAAIRSAYAGQSKSMTDMGTYPFRYDATKQQYSATTPVSFSPSSVTAGTGKITVSNMTVENVGTTGLTNVKIQFYLSSDQTITTSDILLGSFDYNSFPAGGYDDTPFTDIPIPASVPSGSYYVGARILQNQSTTDSITYNNTFATPNKLTVGGGSSGGSCNPASNLTLNGNRFKVQLCAKDPRSGATATGVATEFNANVGYFSIPGLTGDATNIEVFAKVLDGRPINGKFWVFYGGLTDFELTIVVTDLNTGAVKTYTRPGQSLAGGADTNAF